MFVDPCRRCSGGVCRLGYDISFRGRDRRHLQMDLPSFSCLLVRQSVWLWAGEDWLQQKPAPALILSITSAAPQRSPAGQTH